MWWQKSRSCWQTMHHGAVSQHFEDVGGQAWGTGSYGVRYPKRSPPLLPTNLSDAASDAKHPLLEISFSGVHRTLVCLKAPSSYLLISSDKDDVSHRVKVHSCISTYFVRLLWWTITSKFKRHFPSVQLSLLTGEAGHLFVQLCAFALTWFISALCPIIPMVNTSTS